ncbi:DUF6801 domain-containing protein [Streptomyces sp. URMC 129]|uniref:DUF6801 domain-containing protein n=1 Tax=Streptomyces sp. URMC 129 TaxID=3423407 RepID=UPI003F199246
MRVAAVAGVGALVIGYFQAQGSASDDQDVDRTVAYQCGFTTGSRAVEVGFAGVFPVAGEPGRPFAPGDMTLSVTLPQDAAGELLAAEAESFSGEATLTTPVTQNGETAQAQWPVLSAEQSPAPADGEALSVTYHGAGPEITPAAPGDVTFSAGDLVLTFQSDGAESPSRVECAPDPSQAEEARHLATVEVTGGEEENSAAAQAAPEVEGQSRDGAQPEAEDVRPLAQSCPSLPASAQPDPRWIPEPPPGTGEVTVEPGAPEPQCVYSAGFANVAKQNGAMIVNDPARNPQTASVMPAHSFGSGGEGYFAQYTVVQLRFPAARSTFLSFGFAPVSATVEFDSDLATLVTWQNNAHPEPTTTIGFHQTLRLSDIEVNGVPLAVGSNCRTAEPIEVFLEAGEGYDVFGGGRLSGEVEIPPFTGCNANGEDLDALLTATISGPGNHIEFNQGELCDPCTEEHIPSLPEH